MRGVGCRPLLMGGLRGPVGLLVTAALCLSLPLIMNCSDTPISAASSMLCKNKQHDWKIYVPKQTRRGFTQGGCTEQCNSGEHAM